MRSTILENIFSLFLSFSKILEYYYISILRKYFYQIYLKK